MAVLNMFRRTQASRAHAPNPSREKTTQRLNQITHAICRRGAHNDVKCSPYAPCHDVCPVIMPPPGSEVGGDGDTLEDLAAQLSAMK